MRYDTMEAGGELDRLIAEKVMGWVRGGAGDQTKPGHVKETRKRPGQPAEIVDVLDWDQKGPHDYLTYQGMKYMLCGCESHPLAVIPRFSTDITDAWEVVERLRFLVKPKEWDVEVVVWDDREEVGVSVGPIFREQKRIIGATGETAPLAICRLALKAVEAG